jgi:RNA polymerase sigma factor (sigma-70 family)
MPTTRLHNVLAYLRRVANLDADPDADLLRRFIAGRDEAAFEALLRRHGPMVLAVCRRVLDNEADAEDAFQAVFLVLVRRAAAVGRHESVGSFLHGVALRTALRARTDLASRRQHERQAAAMPGTEPTPDPVWHDLRPVLDEEVARLPGKYREPFRLCYLEGKTYDEIAQALGCSKGTVSSRLTRARERLRRRLVGRGVTLTATALAAALAARAAPAAVPPGLLLTTLRAAVLTAAGRAGAAAVSSHVRTLTEGVVQAMSTNKVTVVGGIVLAVCFAGAAGLAVSRGMREPAPAAAREEPAPPAGEGVPAWRECARLGSAVGGDYYTQFSPDGRTLVTIDADHVLHLWDTSTWQPRGRYDLRKRYGDNYTLLAPFSPDARLFSVFGGVSDPGKPGRRLPEVTVLETATAREVARLPGRDGIFCPDGTALVTAGEDTVTLWDVPSFRKRHTLKATTPLSRSWMVSFSDDGKLVCAPTPAGRVYLWETATGKERPAVQGFMPVFAPHGAALVTQLPGGLVKLWDPATGRERVTIRSRGDTGLWPAFSPDGRRLLTFAALRLKADGQPDLGKPVPVSKLRIHPVDVRLWDVATGQELARLPGMDLVDANAIFSPDGKTVAYPRLEPYETEREELVLWDVEAGKERRVVRTAAGVRLALFSHDGKVLFTCDAGGAGLKVWDPATGRRLPDVPGITDAQRLYLSPAGGLLATSPGRHDPTATGPADVAVYRQSDRPLPPPVLRGKPAPETPAPAPAKVEAPARTAAGQALADLQKEQDAATQAALAQHRSATTDAERKAIQDRYFATSARFAARALKIARDHAEDPAALEALELALRTTSGGFGGATGKVRDEALDLVRAQFLRSPDLTRVLYQVAHQYTDPAYDLLGTIAEESPNRTVRGRAALLLAEGLADQAEHARLLRALPDLLKDPELLGKAEMLGKLSKADPDALDRKAEAWYARVRDEYAGVKRYDTDPALLGEVAERGLFAVRHLGIGKTAPDIEGEDLDGKRFKLSDYRGRVVVLIFCGQWCGPCREMNPQKQRLVERLTGKPFALLEVNSDEDREAARRTMHKEGLTWRCWFEGGREGPIARRWNVQRWPTIFVLDGRGVIRYKELRGPALDDGVTRLLREAEAGAATKPGP